MSGGRIDGLRERLAALSPEQRARLEQALAANGDDARPAAPPADDAQRAFPLTEIQQAYWAGRQRSFGLGGVGTHSYTEIDAANLDLRRFTDAWNRLVARHAMLRTVIDAEGSQRVLPHVPPYVIAIEDIGALPPAEQAARLHARREAMSHQLLAADRWPVFEIRATRLGADRVRLHLSFDALIADMSSRRVLMRELGLLYRDPGAILPVPAQTFRDFAQAEVAARRSPAYARARDYWSARDLPPAPALPLRDGYDVHTPPVFVRRTLRLARENLEQAARAFGVTPNVLLMTAYADVLRLWSGGERFTLNLTLFNRPQAASHVIGDFTSLTLLEIGRAQELSFAARARAVQEQLWRDIDHRAFGGVSVLRGMTRAQSGHPHVLMPVVFTSAISDNTANDTAWLGEEVFGASQTPQVWIDLVARVVGGEIVLQWNAVEDLFPPGMSAQMFAALGRLLERLAAGGDADALTWPCTAALLLPDAMRDTRRAANATAFEQPGARLHDGWKRHARETPDRVAVVAADKTLRYGELANIAFALARRLRGMGALPNTLVAIVMRKGWEQVAAVLAVLESGAAYLPIEPETPPARLQLLLADGNVKIVLTQPDLVTRLALPDDVTAIAVDADARQTPSPPLEPIQQATDLAYVIYTSGSSGRPKGVAIDHQSAANTVDDINARYEVGASDRVLALSSLAFDLSVYDIFGLLGAGGAIVMPQQDDARDPARWAALMAQHEVTIWNSVPALMELLADHLESGKTQPLGSLRLTLLSGDRIAAKLPDAMRHAGLDAKVACLGGATEASIWSILHDMEVPAPDRKTIPYGKPLRNQTMHVLAADGVDCPDWVPGDIYIGGAGLARGYWNDPDRTAESFIFDDRRGTRLYRTGDRGCYLPGGSIEFLGREDTQVKLRGYRVELGEIEAALMAHDAVGEAVVVARGADSASRTLAAFAVLRANAAADDILAHLEARLPAHMVPQTLTLAAHLPLTPNGKIDRRALALTPADVQPILAAEPSNESLDRIARIVREASRVAIPSVDSDLIELGLNSIDVIRISNALDAALGVRPDIDAFYAAPTIRMIAQGQPAGGRVQHPPDHVPQARAIERDAVSLPPKSLPPAIEDLLAARRSMRHFALRPVSASSVSGLLEVLRVRPDGTRHYASASALYPIQLYMSVKPGQAEGIDAGSYLYDPLRHALHRVCADRPERFNFAPSNAPVFEEAAFSLLLVADLAALEERYGGRASHLATLEAGLIAQTLELAAPACGLGLCQIGSANEAAIGSLLGLAPRARFVHALFGGAPDTQANGRSETSEEARLQRQIERVRRLAPEEITALLSAHRRAH